MRILLVEDSLDLCEGWADILGLDGHEVRYHLLAREGLADVVTLRQADLLITDYYLPDLNGLDLIRRARELRPNLPAILLTGATDATLRETIARMPSSLLLNKPLRIEELERGIAQVLALAQGHRWSGPAQEARV